LEQRETKRREKERKKAEKRGRKKAKQTHEETPSSPPKLRKRMGRSTGRSQGGREMEEILLSMFQPFDSDSSGYINPTVFWEILQSTDLNLQLGSQEVTTLQEMVTPDRSGLIPYAEFAAHATDIISSLYQDQPPSEEYRVRMATPSGNRVLSYDKQTGHFQDLVEEGVDPFEENIQNMYRMADAQGKGYISREEFVMLFQLEQLQLLNEEDHSQMVQYYDDIIPSGQAQYTDFYPLGKELILRLYRNQDTSGSEWIQLQSEQLGRYQLNKYTGEVRRDTALSPSTAHPQIDLINQAYRQAEEVTFENEQYKQENRDLQNQLRLVREEQETLAAQLDQTGHVLDEANAEIRRKEEDISGLQAVVAGKEHEIEDLKTQLAEAEQTKERLRLLEHELESAQGEVEARDQTMVVRDSSITTLQRQSLGVVDKLKTAWATIDARNSTIAKLQHQLKTEHGKMKSYEEQTPLLEAKVSELEGEVRRVSQTLDEKTSALTTTRKHLKNARERNMELEKSMEKATVTQEKLRGAESEIRTLKGLLTSKTAMVEKRKRDLAVTRAHLLDLEEKDSRSG
jgi:Ca2+-binding EF-hand superfamily protein